MKNLAKIFLTVCLLAGFAFGAKSQSIGINADGAVPDGSALVDVSSTTKGALIPRMTQAQIEAIEAPADGLMAYCITDDKYYLFSGAEAVWKEISYGAETIVQPFVCGATFKDARDGKVYSTVQIDAQCWMKENLAYLPSVVGPATYDIYAPKYYVYGYDGTDVSSAKATYNYQTYGVMYNYEAALISCPAGWHFSTNQEFQTLITYLGGTIIAGGKMKETGTAHWADPNEGATNSSGFTALPGGEIYYLGEFRYLSTWAIFWSNSNILKPAYYGLRNNNSVIVKYEVTQTFNWRARSVRCVKD